MCFFNYFLNCLHFFSFRFLTFLSGKAPRDMPVLTLPQEEIAKFYSQIWKQGVWKKKKKTQKNHKKKRKKKLNKNSMFVSLFRSNNCATSLSTTKSLLHSSNTRQTEFLVWFFSLSTFSSCVTFLNFGEEHGSCFISFNFKIWVLQLILILLKIHMSLLVIWLVFYI